MRITRDLLLKLCRETVEKRFKPDPAVTAVFLVGSVRPENATIAPVSDVDLLVIPQDEPLREREINKLSNEIHFDIRYEPASAYAQPRELRRDPWRGWTLWNPLLLHEKGRFFEYTQAILRAQFDDPANILARARALAEPAREGWTAMQFSGAPALKDYLQALENAANAVAALSGLPLTTRTFLSSFRARAEAAGRPEWNETLLALSGARSIDAETLNAWIPAWETAFSRAQANPEFHPARLGYYKAGIQTPLMGAQPSAGLWPLLVSWAQFADENDPAWQETRRALGLDAAGLALRLQGLDAYLDELEESLEAYAAHNGL